jgi:hypothetical protein
MIENRLDEAVHRIRQMADGRLKLAFIDDPQSRCGIVALPS